MSARTDDGASAGGEAPSAAPPMARVDDAGRWTPIWIVPMVAAVLAAGLAWSAWGAQGQPVSVQFDKGHGLKPGDTVRHLGIVVGAVSAVALDDDAAGVRVEIVLDKDAAALARVGTRFWIVRPELGIAGIAGLDTVIGARYVALLPGTGPRLSQFVGLPTAPVGDALEPGLDITLEGSRRLSLTRGSPITYRGIQVGSVLSVGLASDARTVEVHARIRLAYAELVREDTRFWSTSGVTLDVGLSGVSMHFDTFQSLLRGGVSLATPPTGMPRVRTGHRFELNDAPSSAWLGWEPPLSIGHSLLPPGSSLPRPVRAALIWTEGTFWSGEERREGFLLPVDGMLLAPLDLARPPEDADEGSPFLELLGEQLPVDEIVEAGPRLALVPVGDVTGLTAWPRTNQRRPEGPEDCLVVTEPGTPPLSLAPGRFVVEDQTWIVDPALPVPERFHGAPVLARADGALIGVLLVDDDDRRVVPLPRRVP